MIFTPLRRMSSVSKLAMNWSSLKGLFLIRMAGLWAGSKGDLEKRVWYPKTTWRY